MKKLSKISTIILYIIIVAFMLSLFLIKYFSNKVTPALNKYAKAETKRIITLVINNSISKQISKKIDTDSMFNIERNNENEIKMIDFNTTNVTKILNSITNTIQKNLKAVENGNIQKLNIDLKGISDIDYEEIKNGIIYYVSIGSVSGSTLINNVGPKIPIKFNITGDVVSNIESSVKEYGINNAMIEVKVKVSVTMLVSMPFVSEEVNVETSIPIIMKIIQGDIPNNYLGNLNSNNNKKN